LAAGLLLSANARAVTKTVPVEPAELGIILFLLGFRQARHTSPPNSAAAPLANAQAKRNQRWRPGNINFLRFRLWISRLFERFSA